MKLAAIINTASGSVPNSAAADVQEILESEGHEVEVSEITGEELESCCQKLASSHVDGIVAFGGDGTLTCVLNAFGPKDIPVIILPGGTMNLLVKQVHGGDANWKDILRDALASEEYISLPAIEAAGRRFYVGMLIGKLTELTRTREHLREGAVDKAVVALVTGDVFNFDTSLDIEIDGEALSATAAGVFVPDSNDGAIHVVTIDPDSIADLVKIGVESLYGNWDEANSIESRRVKQVSISSTEIDTIPLTYDGELDEAELPVTFELIRSAAKVWSARSE